METFIVNVYHLLLGFNVKVVSFSFFFLSFEFFFLCLMFHLFPKINKK